MIWWTSLRSGSAISVKMIKNTVNMQNYFPGIYLQGNAIIGIVDTSESDEDPVSVYFYSDLPLKGKYYFKKVGERNASKLYSGILDLSD